MNTLPESEALALLKSIESGEVKVTPVNGPPEYFDVYASYTTPCGWSLCVFNDVGEWDYLESIKSPDGREWNYSDVPRGEETPLQAYQCPEDIVGDVYHWNGRLMG
jgi:hypothetical protein